MVSRKERLTATDSKPQFQPEWAPPREAKAVPSSRMTFEQFLDWMDEDTHAEWVDGEVVMASPASLPHQDILGFLYEVLGGYVNWQGLGKMTFAPFVMKLANSAREPDITFVASTHSDRVRHGYLDGPADLVVEIVSPESVDRDYRLKFAEYEAAGISEYWLIDPEADRVLLYRLGTHGRYGLVSPESGRLYSSVLPGFWLDPTWLAQDPPPSVRKTLFQIGGEPYKQFAQAEFEE